MTIGDCADNGTANRHYRSGSRGWRLCAAAVALAAGYAPLYAQAADMSMLTKAPPMKPNQSDGSFLQSWLAMVSATQAAQPSWMTPLVTVTPRLEQEFRADFYVQNNGTGSQGNGQHIDNYGGPGGFRTRAHPVL